MDDGRWRGGGGDGEIGSLDLGSSRNLLPKQIREFIYILFSSSKKFIKNKNFTLLLGMHKKMRKNYFIFYRGNLYYFHYFSMKF